MEGWGEASVGIRLGGGLPRGARLLLGVSGGPDSVAMAALFRERSPRRGWTVSWAHADHGLRGAESDGDAAFVARLAREWGVSLRTGRVPVAGRGSVEAAARAARYAFLEEAARAAGAGYVLTAHTRDDQAETVLMRLARGSGVRGMRGVLASRPIAPGSDIRLVRPLLMESRERLRAVLAARQIPFRADSSNRDMRFQRNRARAFLADLSPARPDLVARLAGAASAAAFLWERVEKALAPALEAAWRDTEGVPSVDTGVLSAFSEPVTREILREGIRRRGGATLSRAHLAALCRMASGQGGSGRSLDLPGGTWRREYGDLVWVRSRDAAPEGIPIPGAGRYAWGDWHLSVERGAGNGSAVPVVRESLFPLVVRRWRPGDRIRAAGADGRARSRKMSDFWGDRKVPRTVRDAWPLLCREETVVVVPGLAVHAEAAPARGEEAFRVTASGGAVGREWLRRVRAAVRSGPPRPASGSIPTGVS